jgi:site-specific DNA recombinase
MPQNLRAVAYVRVSTTSQELSPDAQKEQVSAYCRLKGFDLVAVLEEVGVSGSVSLSDRPKGAELLADPSRFDTIVFAKLDRAFRDTVDCILTVERLTKEGKTVHFLDLGIDTSTPAGHLCLTMMAAFAKFERQRISERTKEALAQAKANGKKIGAAPIGFRNAVTVEADGTRLNAGVWTPVADELAVVERIRGLRRRGRTLRQIADTLTAEGVPTRRGGTWAPQTVKKIVDRSVN